MKKLYCKKAQNIMACSDNIVISSNEEDRLSIYLSFKRLFDEISKENAMQIYVKLSVYKRIKENFDTISEEELEEVIEILKEIYRLLPDAQKDNLLEKADIVFEIRGFKFDFFQGLSIDNGIVLFNDYDDKTMMYLKSIIR